ncbi:feruloyl esterase A-like protein [Hapsidospora chrysogenum ATCC 11550]|uniref:Feruloyl esterase A-like protein n=1 Tax=Hapsidospora chrysogenum (strain ATCC 11550 / CBS 779.69 / DSM 880 / IAM 14645 / JCM 23072 / IMI 49137) TaxID=857340 RepID=A0A086T8U6_HAPC1|nr:feruloyl esterase A-like protein [Hapsidospora chrysogenum ATCC 11550]
MRLLTLALLLGQLTASSLGQWRQDEPQRHLDAPASPTSISVRLFSELERLARFVDISYCIGNTGVRRPFNCVSRCNEFPSLSLVTTWNTGFLMSDSCGFIAVDHGERRHEETAGDGAVGDKAIMVAFRGTYSITNTVVDLSTIPQKYVPYPSPDHGGGEPPEKPEHECTNCTVHMGFLQSWKMARREVIPALAALKERHPDYPIHLVGHSLGGAVACLAALELKVSLGWDNVFVTTFGEPRVGNHNLARFVDAVFDLGGDSDLEERAYRRVTHYHDPVPLLPLGEWGYASHAGEIFIEKESLSPSEEDVHTCVGDEDKTCSAGGSGSTRYKLWQLFFAHRDYFWRLGLCVPGGDPANWGPSIVEYEYEEKEEEEEL